MISIENVILKNIMIDEEYAKKVTPYIKDEYFNPQEELKLLFNTINDFLIKYNNLPTIEAVKIDARKKTKNPTIIEALDKLLDEFSVTDENSVTATDAQWLLENTEKFCQEKAVYMAVVESLDILNNGSTTKEKGMIPGLLTEALALSFDTNIGHDYFEEYEHRWEFYHKKENKIKFDLDIFNEITNDGVTPKTLNILMAGIHVGKSLTLCHLAAGYLANGYDVLYITMEMSEEAIAQRIDANLYDIAMDDIVTIPKDLYIKKMDKIKSKVSGKLIIKEYPTASANAMHFRNLLNELRLKKNFKPTVLLIDYLNICTSYRIKAGGSANMYYYVKSIAEELRGLAVEYNLVCWSATQVNRTGYQSSDPDMTSTAESFGLPATADFMAAIVVNEELIELDQYLFIQLKNRFKDLNTHKKFIVGVNRSRMRLHDVEASAQGSINKEQVVPDDIPVMDRKNKFQQLKVNE